MLLGWLLLSSCSGSLRGRAYHWRLRARDAWGAWSGAWAFTLAR